MVKPTIRDVAREAGCGVATVSRVLNDTGPASAESRERVLAAARKLDFRFNEIGRSLQSRRSRTLGVIVPTLSNPVFADAINGLQSASKERGYQVLLTGASYAVEEELAALRTLLGKQVEGVVMTVADADHSRAVRMARQARVPAMLLFNQPRARIPTVAVNNTAAAREVGEHLLEHGHWHAAFVAGRFSTSDRSRLRYQGLCESFSGAGAPTPRLLEVDYDATNHTDAVAALLEQAPKTTALFCSNDMLALAVIGALRGLGLDVPRDLSVVGFDGIAVAAMVAPSLSTIATPCDAMGRAAADSLIDAIEAGQRPRGTALLLPHEFRAGDSLSRARAGALPRSCGIPRRRDGRV